MKKQKTPNENPVDKRDKHAISDLIKFLKKYGPVSFSLDINLDGRFYNLAVSGPSYDLVISRNILKKIEFSQKGDIADLIDFC